MSSSTAASISEFASGAGGLIVVMSGLSAGGTRSLAILLRLPAGDVDRVTAVGFLAGAAVAMVILIGELIWG
jgi:hypothetical protein